MAVRNFFPYSILICLLFQLSFTLDPMFVHAETNTASENKTIAIYKEDVTGNGQKETIELKGILLSDDSDYYRDIWATITNDDSEQWRISYGSGYQPEIQFLDLNQDDVNNLLFMAETNMDKGLMKTQLHSLTNGTLKEIPMPVQHYIDTTYENNFKVNVQLSPKSDVHQLDISTESADYIKNGIYNEDQTVIKSFSPKLASTMNYEPLFMNENNGHGLKSEQYLYGLPENDPLGTVETVWYYENNQWIILQTELISNR
ncbi:MAG TPA: hypothetical protein VK044_10700 [Virgibacillus sp.]|nr:hypothetical protein [Virgibacillus sp.]